MLLADQSIRSVSSEDISFFEKIWKRFKLETVTFNGWMLKLDISRQFLNISTRFFWAVLTPGGRYGGGVARRVSTSFPVEPSGSLTSGSDRPLSNSLIWSESRSWPDCKIFFFFSTPNILILTFDSTAFILLFMSLKLVQFMHSARRWKKTKKGTQTSLNLLQLRLVSFIPGSISCMSLCHGANKVKLHKNNSRAAKPQKPLSHVVIVSALMDRCAREPRVCLSAVCPFCSDSRYGGTSTRLYPFGKTAAKLTAGDADVRIKMFHLASGKMSPFSLREKYYTSNMTHENFFFFGTTIQQ